MFWPTQFGLDLLSPAFLVASLALSLSAEEVSVKGWSAAWAIGAAASDASPIAPASSRRPIDCFTAISPRGFTAGSLHKRGQMATRLRRPGCPAAGSRRRDDWLRAPARAARHATAR